MLIYIFLKSHFFCIIIGYNYFFSVEYYLIGEYCLSFNHCLFLYFFYFKDFW